MTNLLLLILCVYPLSLHTPRLPVFRSFSYYGLPSDHSLLDGFWFFHLLWRAMSTEHNGVISRLYAVFRMVMTKCFFQLHPTLCLLSILVHGSFHIYYYQTMSLPFYFLILIFGLLLSWFNIFKFFLNPLLKYSGKAFLSPCNRSGAPLPPQLPRILWIPLFL